MNQAQNAAIHAQSAKEKFIKEWAKSQAYRPKTVKMETALDSANAKRKAIKKVPFHQMSKEQQELHKKYDKFFK